MSFDRLPFDQLPSTQIGREGEALFERLVRDRGHKFVSTCNFSGGDNRGPRLKGTIEACLPDYEVVSDHYRAYAEIKTKSSAMEYRKGHYWQHGIDTRSYRDYLMVETDMRQPVWIVFYEIGGPWPGSWTCKRVSELVPVCNNPLNGMTYFKRDTLDPLDYLWAKLSPKQAVPARSFARTTTTKPADRGHLDAWGIA